MKNIKKILIIGGSGFIGSYLIKSLLKEQFEIINFDKNSSHIESNSLKTIIGDVRSLADFKQLPSDIDLVYVLAAEHKDDISDYSAYYKTNHEGINNIIDYCSKLSINNIIFYSSAAVYGNSFTDSNEEIDNLNPENHYGKSKALAESELNKWLSFDENRKLIVIRPSVVYGKGSNSNMNRMIDYIAKGKFVMVGKGDNFKTICYVENLVDFTVYIQNSISKSYEVYNYADFPHYNIREITNKISSLLKKKVIKIPYFIAYGVGLIFDFISLITQRKNNMSSNRVRKFCSNTSLSTKKIENLGYNPKYSLVESINKSIQ